MTKRRKWRWVVGLWLGRQVVRFLRWRHRRQTGRNGERTYDFEVKIGRQ